MTVLRDLQKQQNQINNPKGKEILVSYLIPGSPPKEEMQQAAEIQERSTTKKRMKGSDTLSEPEESKEKEANL